MYETGADAVVPNEVVTSHMKFLKSKAGVYQELESINFVIPEVTLGTGIKALEPGAEEESKKTDFVQLFH